MMKLTVTTARADLTRRALSAALMAAVMTLSYGTAGATALTPQEKHVSALTRDVIALARSGERGAALQSRVAHMLNRNSNMGAVARFALGPYRSKLPSDRKNEYYKLVETYVANLFAQYVGDFAGTGVEIENSRTSGKFVIVDSRIVSAGTKLKWKVFSKGNSHRITDVNFRGIWLSIRMRDQFVSVLKNNGGKFDALLAYLRTGG